MNIRQLISKNILRNPLVYGTYFLCSSLVIMMSYFVTLIIFQPELQTIYLRISVRRVLFFVYLILIGLSFIFLFYSLKIFVSHRRKEWLVYSELGMTMRDLRLLIFTENMIVGVGSIVAGIGLGVIFSQLVQMLVKKLLKLSINLYFYWPTGPILVSMLTFLFVFVVVSLCVAGTLKVDFSQSYGDREIILKKAKHPALKTFLGFVMILVAYLSVYNFAKNFEFGGVYFELWNRLFIISPFLVMWGTFWIYRYGFSILLEKIRHSRLFFKRHNFLFISEEQARLGNRYLLNYLLTIVLTIAFVAALLVVMMTNRDTLNNRNYAFTFIYSARYNSAGPPAENNSVTDDNMAWLVDKLAEHGFSAKLHEMLGKGVSDGGSIGRTLIPLSDFNSLQKMIGKPEVTLEDNQCLTFPTNIKEKEAAKKNQQHHAPIRILNNENYLSNQALYLENIMQKDFFLPYYTGLTVVTDAYYRNVRSLMWQNKIYVIYVKDWQKLGALADQLESAFYLRKQAPEKESDYFFSVFPIWQSRQQQRGLVIMVFSFLTFSFFVFSIGMLYFSIFDHMSDTVKNHVTLFEIGVSQKERNTLLRKQLRSIFFLPGFVAAIHFIAATFCIQLVKATYFREYLAVQTAAVLLGGYFVFQMIFYLLVKHRYLRLVNRGVVEAVKHTTQK